MVLADLCGKTCDFNAVVRFFMAVLLHAFSHNIMQYCNTSLSCSLSIYPYMSLFDPIILKLIWYKRPLFSSWVCFLLVDVQFGLYWSSLKYIHLLGAAESPNVITVFPYPITVFRMVWFWAGFGFTSRRVSKTTKSLLKTFPCLCTSALKYTNLHKSRTLPFKPIIKKINNINSPL